MENDIYLWLCENGHTVRVNETMLYRLVTVPRCYRSLPSGKMCKAGLVERIRRLYDDS